MRNDYASDGRYMVTDRPTPDLHPNLKAPPRFSTYSLDHHRPNPFPLGFVVKPGVPNRSRSATLTPGPVSVKVMATPFFSPWSICSYATVRVPPSGISSKAFTTILVNTCLSIPRWACTYVRD